VEILSFLRMLDENVIKLIRNFAKAPKTFFRDQSMCKFKVYRCYSLFKMDCKDDSSYHCTIVLPSELD